jgi:CheY-like chemotaxis protein
VSALDRDLLDAFVPEFETEAVRLAMVRDAPAAARALDQLRAMAGALGAPSLAAMVERAAEALDPLDLPALAAAAEALARQARAIGAAGADLPAPTPAASPAAAAAPRHATIDRELLEAFAPEFDIACTRLSDANDAAAAARALDALRAMAGTAGLASLRALLDRGPALVDAGDLPALARLAEAARAHAARILVAGEDVAPPADAPPAAAPAQDPGPPDAELLAAFLPDFAAACTRLAEAREGPAARRAADTLAGMAGALGLGSIAAMLAAAPLDPFDAAAMPGVAAALTRQARAVAAAGHDLPSGTRRRVLVVDDSPMMRRLVREIIAADPDFELAGEAADGRAALAAMASLRPDLTLLDIEMPELDGIGVLRHWALRGGGAVVVVSSAARPGSAVAVEARRLGAAGIVGKPSGALSPDLRDRQGDALRRAARRASGLPVAASA